MNDELKTIKNKYGEKMAHLCRELFPTLLETEGLLLRILTSKFNEDRFLYESIINNHAEESFKDYIYSFIDVENNFEIITSKTPKELLSDAGYDFYECHSEEDIQSFKKYYKSGEDLCTFNGHRLNSCYVFFAVKKNVDEIKRENFPKPSRQDEYGTSVISIQFTKGSNTLSIKNRYNHAVNQPDATFSNNLDNIIPGLTESFGQEYNLDMSQNKTNFELSSYVLASDGKFYRYNQELNNIYYCPDNIIIDNNYVRKLDKSKYLLMDYHLIRFSDELEQGQEIWIPIGLFLESYIVNKGDTLESIAKANRITVEDLKYFNPVMLINKKGISLYDDELSDSFSESIGEVEKIKITNQGEEKELIITPKTGENITIKLNKYNQMIYLYDPNQITVGDDFLFYNETLQALSLPNLTTVANYFYGTTKPYKN